jgi:hypothetical protein
MTGDLLKEVKFMWNFLWQDKKRWPFRWLFNRGNSMGRFDCISEREHVATMTWLTVIVPLVVNTSQSFPHSWLIPGLVIRWTRWVPLVEQELLTLPEHLSSPLVFSGVCVIRSLVLCICFVDRCLSFCLFSFGHCVVCSSI